MGGWAGQDSVDSDTTAASPTPSYSGAESDRSSSNIGGPPSSGNGGNGSYLSQGRGSNVTDARPLSPAEAASGVGPGGPVNFGGGGNGGFNAPSAPPVSPIGIPQSPVPFFGITPTTVGVPSLVLGFQQQQQQQQQYPTGSLPPSRMTPSSTEGLFSPVSIPSYGAAAFNQVTPITPTSISTISPGTQSIPGYQAAQPYSGPHGQTMSEQERWAGGGVFNNLESLYNLPEGTLGRIMKTESTYGTNPDAYKLTSAPSGPFQISESTGRSLGVVGPGFDYRLDPVQSAAAAAKYSAEISDGLRPVLGRAATTGEIGLGYQQGIGGARALLSNPDLSAKEALAKALGGDVEEAARRIRANGGDPDAPASQFSSQKISQYGGGAANPPTLTAGLEKLMATVTGTASDVVKAAMSAPGKFADTLNSLLTTPEGSANVPVPSPVNRSYREAGSADVFQGTPAMSPQTVMGDGFAVPGGQQTAAQVASSSPQSFGAWLGSLFDTNNRIKELEAQGRTSTYPDESAEDVKQWYADQYANGDVSKVQSRVVDMGQGPVVDYYVKDLGTTLMEGFSSPFKAVGSMISGAGRGIESLPRGTSVRDRRFLDLLSQTEPSRGYGPNGDMTLQEYRQTYGR